MNQTERNDQLQRENTTLRAKLTAAEARIESLSESVLMASEMLMHKDNENAELSYALSEANQEIGRLKSEVSLLRVAS